MCPPGDRARFILGSTEVVKRGSRGTNGPCLLIGGQLPNYAWHITHRCAFRNSSKSLKPDNLRVVRQRLQWPGAALQRGRPARRLMVGRNCRWQIYAYRRSNKMKARRICGSGCARLNGRDRLWGIALFPIAARAPRFAPANSARYRSRETTL
jgi:hypothetical protein